MPPKMGGSYGDRWISPTSHYLHFSKSISALKTRLPSDITDHYKHVAIGIATMTVHDSQPNQVTRFIILSN